MQEEWLEEGIILSFCMTLNECDTLASIKQRVLGKGYPDTAIRELSSELCVQVQALNELLLANRTQTANESKCTVVVPGFHASHPGARK